MNRQAWPLELVLQSGTASLLGKEGQVLWASDDDEEFREACSEIGELVTEHDMDDVLDYLEEAGILSEREAMKFEDGEFETSEIQGEDELITVEVDGLDGTSEDHDEDDEPEVLF